MSVLRRLALMCSAIPSIFIGFFGFAILVVTPTTGFTQGFEVVGTRAMGMAGAFVGVADDATAAYWNPAGLSMGAFLSFLVDRTAVDGRVDAADTRAAGTAGSGAFVGLSTNAVALSYYRVHVHHTDGVAALPLESGGPGSDGGSISDSGSGANPSRDALIRSMTLQNVVLTSAQLLAPNVSLGSNLRYVRGRYGVGSASAGTTGEWLDEARQLDGRGQNAFDMDLGLKVGRGAVQVGLVARNLLQPTLDAPDGSTFRLDRHIRAGVAIRPAGRLLVAVDVDLRRQRSLDGRERRNLALGAEHWFGQSLALRGGVRVDLEEWRGNTGEEPAGAERRNLQPVGAVGFSVALTTGVFLDGQLTRGREDRERGWSLAGRVAF